MATKALRTAAKTNSKFEPKMSRKGNLNLYYVRIFPDKPRECGKTCYTRVVSATTKSTAIKQAGNLAFKLGIEARQITVFHFIIPKSEKRKQKMLQDYAKQRQEMKSRKLKKF